MGLGIICSTVVNNSYTSKGETVRCLEERLEKPDIGQDSYLD